MFMFDDHSFMFIILKIKDWLTCVERISRARFQNLGQKFFYEYLLKDEQDLSVGEMLTVYFGTPNMFITLWFGFYCGTNPPLGTLMIYQVQLCVCIWKCYAFVGKYGHKGRSHNKFEGAIKESLSCLRAWCNHSQRWQGPKCYKGTFLRIEV
jgi:hypothetical protein